MLSITGSGTSSLLSRGIRDLLDLSRMSLSNIDWFLDGFGRLLDLERVTVRLSLSITFDDDGLAMLLLLPLSIDQN